MNTNIHEIKLTDLQISHAIAALQRDLDRILSIDDELEEGGEHEDYLIIQSIISALKKSKYDQS